MNQRARSRMETKRALRVCGGPGRLERLWTYVCGKTPQQRRPDVSSEEGASLVEMALSATVVFMMLFGVIEICLAFYTYNYVSDAAREATRYAIVRGAPACDISITFPNCDLKPASIGSTTDPTQNPVLQYIESLGYPGLNPSYLSANVTWWSAHVTQGGANGFSTTDWNTQCTSVDLGNQPCNTPGDAVQVVVTYAFPLNIPFLGNQSINVTSTSKMVISE